jgi:hypothetical protein
MDPVVQRLASMGYPVRKVDIDQQRDLASRFRVQGVPCFVMVVDGREVDRVVGATSLERLQQMFARHAATGNAPSGAAAHAAAGQPRGGAPASAAGGPRRGIQARGQSPDGESAALVSADPALDARLMAASVRLKIEDPNGHSYGSGTIIDVRGQEAIVLTCGHIFRDSKGQGRILVDLFGSGAPQGIPGRLISYDLPADVGLVSFRSNCALSAAPVAPAGYRVAPGDRVINIGCNNGGDPTVRHSRVTTIDKFLGPPNLQVAGQPVVGRSGGGLFSADGLVIGVCNAADPTDNEGLYAALPSIWGLLDKQGLAGLYQRRATAVAQAPARSAASDAALDRPAPAMPQQMPAATMTAPLTDVAPAGQAPAAQGLAAVQQRLTAPEQAALAQLQGRSGAEVICIVRPTDPRGKSEVIVLDKASQEFLRQLEAERGNQGSRHLTSLQVDRAAATPAAPRPTSIPVPPWQPKWQKP